jgi:hypothetical protein
MESKEKTASWREYKYGTSRAASRIELSKKTAYMEIKKLKMGLKP